MFSLDVARDHVGQILERSVQKRLPEVFLAGLRDDLEDLGRIRREVAATPACGR